MTPFIENRLRELAAGTAQSGIDAAIRIRDAHFNCSSVYDDWMRERCSTSMWNEQMTYKREFSAEAVLRGDPPGILFDDEYIPSSSWLREKRSERLERFGPVDDLTSHPRKTHLVELTACLRMFTRARQLLDDSCILECQRMNAEYDLRRSNELEFHQGAIAKLVSGVPVLVTEKSLSAWALNVLVEKHLGIVGEIIEVDSFWGAAPAMHWPVGSSATLVLLPSFSLSGERQQRPTFSGSLGFVFQLTMLEDLKRRFERSRDALLQVESQFPEEMQGYRYFVTKEELALNMLAWANLLGRFLPHLRSSLSVP